MKELESQVQSAILEYLGYTKHFHYRNNTGALKTERGHFVRFGAVGSPDIILIVKGFYIGCEVKGTDGKQSDKQKEFQDKLERAGGKYFLAHSLDEFKESLDKIIKYLP